MGKGIAGLIADGLAPPDKINSASSSASGDSDEKMCARDIVNAARNSDPEAMAKALALFIDIHLKETPDTTDAMSEG